MIILLSGKKKFINKDINEMIIIPKIKLVEYSEKFCSLFLVKIDPNDVNMIVPNKEYRKISIKFNDKTYYYNTCL